MGYPKLWDPHGDLRIPGWICIRALRCIGDSQLRLNACKFVLQRDLVFFFSGGKVCVKCVGRVFFQRMAEPADPAGSMCRHV